MNFASLHNHTVFSIGDSLIECDELFTKAKELNLYAVGVCDHATLGGNYDLLKASRSVGIKLIIGCEFNFLDNLSIPEQKIRHICLYAKNEAGYRNLLQLNKLANDNGIISFKKVYPRIDWKLLEQYSEGLICLTACSGGILGSLISNRQIDEAKKQAQKLKDIFGDNLGLEVQANGMVRQANNYHKYLDQQLVNSQLIKFGEELNIRIVPTSNSHYINKEDAPAHDAFLAGSSGQPIRSNARLRYTQDEFYLKSGEEIKTWFQRLYPDKIDQWIANSCYFADLCGIPNWIEPQFDNPGGQEIPNYPIKDEEDYPEFLIWLMRQSEKIQNLSDGASYMRYQCELGMQTINIDAAPKEKYLERLDEEYEIFEAKGFSDYMLHVWNYLRFCRKKGWPSSPGRGSCGNSMVGYFLRIHAADCLKFNLVFARFQNRERKIAPDVDGDFPQFGKPIVEEYLREKYGKDNICQISNHIVITPKPFAKLISRIFEYGGDRKTAVKIGAQIADSISKEYHSVESALAKAPLFIEYANHPKYSELKKYGKIFDGKPIALGKHAAGIIIAKRPLSTIVPLRRDKENNLVLEWEKVRAEANGLIKYDILGLSNLDLISITYDLIKKRGKTPPSEPFDYNQFDQKTYDLISSGQTFGVFQLGESAGTINLCRQIKPQSIEDISIINALARPSAKEFRQDLIAIRNGEKELELLHPALERAFKPTYGFGLYDDSLITLSADCAGWNLHKADNLRKMTKDKGKDPVKTEKLRQEFINDAQANKGISKKIATEIWDNIIGKFEAYGFCHSHSILYSMLGFQTAYLKTHFPIEFLVANLNFESSSSVASAADNIQKLRSEIRQMGIKILPPDLNESQLDYTIVDDQTIRTGLSSLKFIGSDSVPEIIFKRPFQNLSDFLSRVDGKKVRAPSVQALAAAGCLDIFGQPRKQIFLYAGDYKKKLQVWNKKPRPESLNYPWPDTGEFTIPEKYALEKTYLGEGLSGTLYQVYPGFFTNQALNFSQLPSFYPENMVKENSGYIRGKKKNVQVDGSIQAMVKDFHEWIITKEGSSIIGKTMARLTLADPYGNSLAAILFPESLVKFKESFHFYCGPKAKIEQGVVLHLSAEANWYEGNFGLIITGIRKAALAPVLPPDIKPKSISLSLPRSKKKNATVTEVLEEIEDQIDFEGLLEETQDILTDDSAEEDFEF